MSSLPMSVTSWGATKVIQTGRSRCPTASELQDWVSLPGLVDGVASPEPRQVLASAMRLEAISRRHPTWLDAYQATLVCVARLAQGETRQLLFATVLRLDLSPGRRRDLEAMAS
jgi:hypothetical protein